MLGRAEGSRDREIPGGSADPSSLRSERNFEVRSTRWRFASTNRVDGVRGLAAKPIIDLQVSVASFEPLEAYCGAMERAGVQYWPEYFR